MKLDVFLNMNPQKHMTTVVFTGKLNVQETTGWDLDTMEQ